MKIEYKKGDILIVYSKSSKTNSGILLNKSRESIVLAHNFRDVIPLDTTMIPIKEIVKIEKITPVEINTVKQLKGKEENRAQ
jgi:hypothetical protein